MAISTPERAVDSFDPSSQAEDNVISAPRSEIAPDPIVSVPVDPEDELGGAGDDYKERKSPIQDDTSAVESKKKKDGFEDAPIAENAPPPYTAVSEGVVRKPLWKRRRFLLAAIAALLLFVIILAVSLGVELSKEHGKSGSLGISPTSGSSSNPSSPSSTNPSSPSATAHSGNASPPLRNTAIAAVSIRDTTSSNETPLVQVFFQDSDFYLCAKTSTSGVETWPLSDSGTRLFPALNGTPIAAVHQPDFQIPIRVFFINTAGYLADIYQSTWGGPCVNGSLADRQFQVGEQEFGETYNSVSAGWCSSEDATVFAMGTDLRIYAFQASGQDAQGNGGTWSIVWQSDRFYVSVAVNTAALCLLSIDPAPPVLFVNAFDGIQTTGQLISVINSTNASIPLPQAMASRYRPNSPIAAVYGSFAPVSAANPDASNNTMFLFFPLPDTLSSISPNPSLYTLSAAPYWSADAPLGDSVVATMFSLNWTDAQLVNTGVVPFANGASALFEDGEDLSVDNDVTESMPRAWTPLLVGGGDGEPAARAVVVYLDGKGAMQVSDVIGGGSGTYPVINAVS